MIKNQVNPPYQSNLIADTFYGYNHHFKIGDGTFYDMRNMSTAEFPLLTTRKNRGYTFETGDTILGMIKHHVVIDGVVRECIVSVDAEAIYYQYINEDGAPATRICKHSFTPDRKQMITGGAYIYIFPDKIRVNMSTPEVFEPLEANNTVTTLEIMPCWEDGTYFTANYTGPTEPQNPTDGYIWCDTHDGNSAWKKWYAGSTEDEAHWIFLNLDDVHVKVTYVGIGVNVKRGDIVHITGANLMTKSNTVVRIGGAAVTDPELDLLHELEGYHEVIGANDGNVWFKGNVRKRYLATFTGTDSLTLDRLVPDMDYICECNNRLWGCKYGFVDGQLINELYCSKLGDPTNWRAYQGLSTDSWAASCGSDGAWTGCMAYNGYPTFFKESSISKIYISSTGAHQVVESALPGVQRGCSNSLNICNGILYYKGRNAVYAYDGGYPRSVSEALGEIQYDSADAGSANGIYYICMRDMEKDEFVMLTYNTKYGIWAKEDEVNAQYFANMDGRLWVSDTYGSIFCVDGKYGDIDYPIEWHCVSGIQYYGFNAGSNKARYPDVNWYTSRYFFRMELEPGTKVRLYIEYDSSGEWEYQGEVTGDRFGSYLMPVMQNRCDHLRYRIEGIGGCKLWMIARKMEEGSDEI